MMNWPAAYHPVVFNADMVRIIKEMRSVKFLPNADGNNFHQLIPLDALYIWWRNTTYDPNFIALLFNSLTFSLIQVAKPLAVEPEDTHQIIEHKCYRFEHLDAVNVVWYNLPLLFLTLFPWDFGTLVSKQNTSNRPMRNTNMMSTWRY